MSTEKREQPLRFSWPDVGSSRLSGKKPLSFMAYDSDLGRSVASEPHALPEMATLHPPQAPPPSPSLAGVFRPSQDPTHIGQGFRPGWWCCLAGPESSGGWRWESWARADWVGQARGAGKGGKRAPQVSHPQTDNTQAGVGKSSSVHRGDAGFAHVLPQAPCHAGGGVGRGATLSLSSAGSSSTGLAHPNHRMRQEGLGILLLTLPTAGRSDL